MRPRSYKFRQHKSSASERDELPAAIREIEQHMRTLAEAEKRRATVRTCRIIARRERGERRNRGNPTWRQ